MQRKNIDDAIQWLNIHKDFLFSLACCLSHIVFVPIFYFCAKLNLCIYNIAVSVFYIMLFFLYGELSRIVFLTLTIVELLFYCVFSTVSLSLDCGMQFLSFSLLPAVFFLVRSKGIHKAYYMIVCSLCVAVTIFITIYTGTPFVVQRTLKFLEESKITDATVDDFYVQLQYCYNAGIASLIFLLTGFFSRQDIQNALQESQEKSIYLDFISNHDPLTKLLNRRKSSELAKSLDDAFLQGRQEWAVTIFDIDDFKKVNDVYGHSAGDEVLVAISDIITKKIDSLLKGIQFSRWGGEEFLLIFPFAGSLPLEILQDLGQLVSQKEFSFVPAGFDYTDRLNIHLTFGLSFSFQRHRDADDLINIADEYLRCGKQHGKNCIITEEEYLEYKKNE